MARLRVSMSDDPKHQPIGVHVVGRQRLGWVALLAAYAALLCLPAFRNAMTDQVQMVATGQAPSWLSGVTAGVGIQGGIAGDRYRERLRQVLAQLPRDVDLQLGALVLGIAPPPAEGMRTGREADGIFTPVMNADPRLRYLADLRGRFPANPAVVATSLRYYCLGSILIRRKFKHETLRNIPGKDRRLNPVAAREILAIAAEGERAEPNNAMFATMAATVHVAAGQDEAAVAAMRRAARCSFWRDYTWVEGGGAERLMILAYGDHGLFMRASPLAAVLLPHLAQLRSMFQVLQDRLDNTRSGWELRSDMLRVGGLLRDGGETLISRLVGAALQEIAFGTDEVRAKKGHGAEQTEAAKQQLIAVAITRAERDHPATLSILKREAEGLADFWQRRKRMKQIGETWEALMRPAIQRELLGLHLLGNLLGCMALWGISALILFAGSVMKWPTPRGLSERLSRPAYVALIAVAFGALLIPLGAAAVSPANAPFDLGLALCWLVFVVRPLVLRSGPIPMWSPALIAITATAAMCCTLAVTWPWEFATHTSRGYWMEQLRFLGMFDGEWPSQEARNPLGFVLAMGPAPLATFACVCAAFAALLRRGSSGSWLEGTRGVAQVLSAVLAVGYLVFTLVHAPATLRDGRIASQNFRNETAILDQR